METTNNSINKVNISFWAKLNIYLKKIIGMENEPDESQIEPLPVTQDLTNLLDMIVNNDVMLEQVADNSSFIPKYYKLTPTMVKALYNLVTSSYWNIDSWEALKEHAFQKEIRSQLGLALRQTMSNPICFPAVN